MKEHKVSESDSDGSGSSSSLLDASPSPHDGNTTKDKISSDEEENESPNTSRTTRSSNTTNESHKTKDSDDEEDDEENKTSSDRNANASRSERGSSVSGSDSNGSNNGSDSDEKSDDDDDDDDEDKSDASSDSEAENNNGDEDDADSDASGHSHSSSESDSHRTTKKKNQPAWEHNPDMYGVRRSGRDRRQPPQQAPVASRDTGSKKPASSKPHKWRSSGSSGSDSDASPAPRPATSGQGKRSAMEQRRRIARSGGAISYKEDESNSDDSYVTEDDDDETSKPKQAEEENAQTIEKIIHHRIGKRGAVGMQTYIYEVEKKGDPNTDFDPEDPSQVERQFLVKWKGWAHIHNTWESQESLKTQKVKGLKKLDNFLRKEEELMLWKNSATPEEIEYLEIQSELERELNFSHINADRIFAMAEENGNEFYYVKWEALPYSECTWEVASFIEERFPDKVEMFKRREESTCTPRQCPALKHRPKFVTIKEQPDFLGGSSDKHLELRDYQMQGLNWLVHAWCKHNSVILADEMGLGKTIQAISFLSYLFHTHSMYGPYLLVLPLSTINAWEREFALWAPDMNVISYIGDRDSRKIIRDYEWAFSSKRLKFNVVLTTYEILLRDKDELKECMWSVMAIDEAHRLKNEESQLYMALKEFKTNHRLLITGTPLQNSLKELWALLHFIMPDKFDSWPDFEAQHDKSKMQTGFQKLHRQLEPFLLRRVKKDVEKSLPSKVEQILRVDMTKEQKQYYKWILTKNYEMLRKGTRGSTSSFCNIVMELKKCCNHSFLIKAPEEIAHGTTEMLQQLLRGSGKLVLLDKLLLRLHETGHRVLIFSQMMRQLDILSQYLQLRRLSFQRLDGSIRGELRKQALDHFNAENSTDFCFLLSTRAGGLGINLATADTVIIFDSDWNPQNDLQAQARAHRIGQKNQVNIYRLVTKNSIEENIIERAKQKMVLDHLVIQSMDTSGRTVFNKKLSSNNSNPFNKEELNAILKFGADELFKDADDETEEPVCDIDEILRRAETREDGPASAGDDLLSAFKVASINLDEDEELSRLESVPEENTKDWDEIIPESLRNEVKEEARAKEMAELYLAPRNRKTLLNTGTNDKERKEDESSSSEESGKEEEEGSPRKRGRPKGSTSAAKESVKGFTDAEVRRFFRSMKRFSNPLRRLDTISRDADLRDRTHADLKRLAETIIDHCHNFMTQLEKNNLLNPQNKGPPRRGKHSGNSFKLSGVSINAKTTLATLEELAPLDTAVPHAPVQRASWVLPFKKVKDTHWDTTWTLQDDSRLLCGIYEYGMGSWEQIKADPALNLGDKILLDGDLKPQAKQLESRAQYLLKLIRKHGTTTQLKLKTRSNKVSKSRSASKIKEPKGISKEIIDDDSSDDDVSKPAALAASSSVPSPVAVKQPSSEKETKERDVKDEKEPKEKEVKSKLKEQKIEKDEKVKEEKEPKVEAAHVKKKRKKDKDKPKGPVHITANGEPTAIVDDIEMDANHPLWSECKEKMRPMKKFLQELSSGGGDNCSQEDQIAHTKRCLLKIGDHISYAISSTNPEHTDSWKVLLWRFVSKFTEYDAKKLHKFYKKTKKQEQAILQQGGGSDPKEKKKEKHKDSQDKAKHEKNTDSNKPNDQRPNLKRKPESQNEVPNKKTYNGDGRNAAGTSDRDRQMRRDDRRQWDARDGGSDYRDRRDRRDDRDRSADRRNDDYHRRHRDSWRRGRGDGRYHGGYHRDGYNKEGYGGSYHRGGAGGSGEWRGNSGRHPPHYGGYQPPHYPPPPGPAMYGGPPLIPSGPPHYHQAYRGDWRESPPAAGDVGAVGWQAAEHQSKRPEEHQNNRADPRIQDV
ncbi:chromodomain-helicase-DNA-binding protein 1 isoform X2 [Hyalella azteca]|uniref:Chromodomain-helicase-DNA-binding protein 1 isoform X2 n=1 Tax=Hyalella azteca TaxID=294128 RepID=A0A8B7MZS9_HYAAZ|nr:chromodomain-helicase-DNA-binding protein 1 isoform X2 [Hyalella azteca]